MMGGSYEEDPEYQRAKIAEAVAKAEKSEIDLGIMKGNYVEKVELEETLLLLFRYMNENLQSLPSEITTGLSEHLPSRNRKQLESLAHGIVLDYIEKINKRISSDFQQWIDDNNSKSKKK